VSRAARRAAESQVARARRRRVLGIAVAIALVLGSSGTGAWWLFGKRDTTPASVAAEAPGKACSPRTPVHLWVSETMEAAALALAEGYQAEPSAPCVEFTVEANEPMAAMLGLGENQPNRPDGWIPDSPRWVDRVNAATHLDLEPSEPFARSPLVIAMDPTHAKKMGASADWLELVAADDPIRLSDPRSTTAGMLAISAAVPHLAGAQARVALARLAEGATNTTEELFETYNTKPGDLSAFPASEADVIEHNEASPGRPLVGVLPADGATAFEYALIDVTTDPAKSEAIKGLQQFLQSERAAQLLADHGFRSTAQASIVPTKSGAVESAGGSSPTLEQVSAATDLWQSATTDFRLLAVFDVSGSMREKVGASTRIGITKEAAGIALAALPPTTDLGIWTFSIGLGENGADHREVTPIKPLTDEAHRNAVAAAAAGLDKQVGGGTALYDTIWAAYQRILKDWNGDRVNAVVILTDGRNEDPDGMSFAELMKKLEAANDPSRPVAITTIGIGPDVDAGSLTKVSELMHSSYYAAPDPADMTTVLAKALFDHECKDGRCV
jgi:hypothetical protein